MPSNATVRKGPLETRLEGSSGVLLGWHPKSRCLKEASLSGPANSSAECRGLASTARVHIMTDEG